MPWHAEKSPNCPESRPWAVIRDADGEVEGCHVSREAANMQVAALYAQESLEAMQHKSFTVDVKAADSEAGTFEALVAVFGNVDSVGDRIIPGAFQKTLARWRASGDPIPVILSHKHDDPMAHIGIADPNDVVETERGLQVRGSLDIADNETAKQVHRLMRRRSLKEFSFGYRIPRGGEKAAKDGANELLEIDLVEIGPTLKGANPSTELHAVKTALGKATWSTAYVNALPDSAFLYVEPGGEKDEEGRTTPRSLRHFPYKAVGGRTDMAHLRNAAARISQSNLSGDVKSRLAERCERLLNERKDAPPDEESQRRAIAESELRDLMEGQPDAQALAAESVEQLNERVKGLAGELESMRTEVKESVPASGGALQRRSQEQRLAEADVPEGEVPPLEAALDARMGEMLNELTAIKSALESKPEPPPPEPLTADQLRRKHSQERLSDAEVPEGEPEPEPDQVADLKSEVERLADELASVREKVEQEPEPSEEELRRSDARERLKAVPEGEPPPDRVEELESTVKRLEGELAEVKSAPPPPPVLVESEETLRRRAARERLKSVPEGKAPDRVAELEETVKRLEAEVKAAPPEPPPPPPEPKPEEALRRQDAEERLRKAEVVPASPVDPLKDLTELMTVQMQALQDELASVKAAVEAPEPTTEDELRRRAQAERLKTMTKGVPPAPPEADKIDELREQLKKLADAVADMTTAMEKKLDRIEDQVSEDLARGKGAGQDPLRARSDQVVLDIASRGLSTRKPPTTREPERPPEGPGEQALRRQSRDVMLELLTGREDS